MKRNNVKLLTDREFCYLNEKYIFSIVEDNISVGIKDYNRVTYHSINAPFHINAKGVRKVCFNMDAIEIWKTMYGKNSPTLLEVQQAVNKLTITFQKVTLENVKKLLSGQDIKIKKV